MRLWHLVKVAAVGARGLACRHGMTRNSVNNRARHDKHLIFLTNLSRLVHAVQALGAQMCTG